MGLLLQLTRLIADPNLNDGIRFGVKRYREGGKGSLLMPSLKVDRLHGDICLSEIGRIASIYAHFDLVFSDRPRPVRARIFAASFDRDAPACLEGTAGLLIALILLRELSAAALICIVKDFKGPHAHPKPTQPFLPKALHRTTSTALRCPLNMLWTR